MPLGSQEGASGPYALAMLEAHGESATITLRELAGEMRHLVEGLDSASASDVTAALATRLLDRLPQGRVPMGRTDEA